MQLLQTQENFSGDNCHCIKFNKDSSNDPKDLRQNVKKQSQDEYSFEASEPTNPNTSKLSQHQDEALFQCEVCNYKNSYLEIFTCNTCNLNFSSVNLMNRRVCETHIYM